MSEESKTHDLEFITVEAGAASSAADAPATNIKSPGGKNSKTEDGEALLSSMRKTVSNAKHPVAAFFHLLFKVDEWIYFLFCRHNYATITDALYDIVVMYVIRLQGLALFTYMFGGVLFSSYVFIFVVCILLLAFDFWTVKNVTGRLLVGLRWWNRINEDGTNEWVFESHEDMTEIDALDSQVFWTGLYGTPAIWTLLFIVAVLKFNIQWALIVAIALMLSAANIIGYTKCKKDARQKMHSLMSQGALGALSTSAGSSIMSTIGGLALGGATSLRGKQPATGQSVTV